MDTPTSTKAAFTLQEWNPQNRNRSSINMLTSSGPERERET